MTSLVQLPAIPGINLDPTSNVDLLSFPTVTQPSPGLGMGTQTPAPAPAPAEPTSLYTTASSAPTGAVNTSSNSGGGNLATAKEWFDAIVSRALTPNSWLTLEDLIFLVIGLILIAAAVFSFKGTQTVIEQAGRVATRVGEAAG